MSHQPAHPLTPTLPPPTSERVRIRQVEVLSDSWYTLKKTTFDYRMRDGRWQTLSRETYDRGNGATLLLFNRTRATVLLTRQFRFPAYVNGCADGLLIETCAGLLDGQSPEAAIRREAQEELGVEVGAVTKIMEAYMSPGSVTEKLHFFVGEYERPQSRDAGNVEEGEEIEVLELALDDALSKIARGEIQDGKTILLLLWARAHLAADLARA
ncbi:MAG: NUDIX domain-containing protein [Gluconacetobacter diazotrophicus]|nr:NUDIX domain-containing protein [Gluconacetobacter diazotrophicus]